MVNAAINAKQKFICIYIYVCEYKPLSWIFNSILSSSGHTGHCTYKDRKLNTTARCVCHTVCIIIQFSVYMYTYCGASKELKEYFV